MSKRPHSPSALLGTRLPLAAAPMAGGPSTVELGLSVAKAGAFPFLAGGYKTAEQLAQQIQELRAGLENPDPRFGVNLFVPSGVPTDVHAVAEYAEQLASEARTAGVDPESLMPSAEQIDDDDDYPAKLAMLLEHPLPVVSLTFALPGPADIVALQKVGTAVLMSVTTVDEAELAQQHGVDGLVVQGPRAGGHSATLSPQEWWPAQQSASSSSPKRQAEQPDPDRALDASIPLRSHEPPHTAEVVAQIRAAVDLPIIGAGGVGGPGDVQAILGAGAEAVAVGTLLLCAGEAGTSATHRAALSDPRFTETTLTRAFTGRPARALRNAFIERHQDHAPNAYPALHHLTKPIRQRASSNADPENLHLWAGTAWEQAAQTPAHKTVTALMQGGDTYQQLMPLRQRG